MFVSSLAFTGEMKKSPTIRPGQRMPYQRGKQREIADRRECVARLLIGGARKMEIHRLIKSQFNRQWRTADRDILFVTRAAKGVSLRPKCAREPCSEALLGIAKQFVPPTI